MSRRGENIYKRQDGRWEARYIKARDATGRAVYGYIYRHSYLEAKRAQAEAKATCGKQEISGEKQSFRQMTLGEYMNRTTVQRMDRPPPWRNVCFSALT